MNGIGGPRGLRRARRGAPGFTMVELLVAGLLSALVLLSVYFVFIGNTTQYYRQEQIVQMQESMRFALEYLKNDLRNAGRLGLVRGSDPDRDPRLCTPRPTLAALTLCEEADPALAMLRANGNGLEPDRLRLLGDSGGGVMLKTRLVRPDRVVLAPPEEQGTAEAQALVASQRRLGRLFARGSLVAVRAPGFANTLDVVEVAGLAFNAGGSTVQLASPLCNDPAGVVAPTLSSCSGECLISPVQIVEYAVAVDPDPRRDQATRLVRRVLPAQTDMTACDDAPAPLEELEMAEMVVDLQLWGMFEQPGAPPTLPADPDPSDTRGNRLDRSEDELFRTALMQLRSLTVMIAVRTPREDPEYTVAIDRATAPADRVMADRAWFEADPTPGTGMSRVATLTATVDAMNLTPSM